MLDTALPGPVGRMLASTTLFLVLLTTAYYVVPLRFDWTDSWTLGRLLVSLLALALLGVLFRYEIARSNRVLPLPLRRIQWLLTALYTLVLLFALVYAATAAWSPSQFDGIQNRTDALYFSVTVVSTVGFGDIHATGTVGRLLTTLHMVFNLIYLGTALRLLTSDVARQPNLTDEQERTDDPPGR
jgi:hypothetical protein